VPAREGAAPAADGGATPAKARKLIVDEEPPFPPELVARLNKLTTNRRRRGPSTTIQGSALALAVALLVVVLARQAGFGKRLGMDSADTSARQVFAVTPAPPLELGAGDEPRRPVSHRATSPSAGTTGQHKRPKLILTPTEPGTPEPSSKQKPTPKKAVATTHAQSPALPALPYPSTTSAPATTSAPTTSPTGADQSPTNPHQKFAIVAGSFQSNDMAKAEKDHLARLVQYRVWVNKSKVEGKRSYQLMVGRFDSMERAWDASQSLMRRGLIRDANVQPLPE
jgi:hypothetical protein